MLHFEEPGKGEDWILVDYKGDVEYKGNLQFNEEARLFWYAVKDFITEARKALIKNDEDLHTEVEK